MGPEEDIIPLPAFLFLLSQKAIEAKIPDYAGILLPHAHIMKANACKSSASGRTEKETVRPDFVLGRTATKSGRPDSDSGRT